MLRTAKDIAHQQNGGTIVQESRRAKRYLLSAPVLFSWQRSDGKLQACEGVTRDISMRGIFVLAAEIPEVGAYVELDAHVPPTSRRGRTSKLHGEGRVLRIESNLDVPTGFAAEVFFQSEPQTVETILGAPKIQ